MSAGFRQKRVRKQSLSLNQGLIRTGARTESVTGVQMKDGFRQPRARKRSLSPNKRLIQTGATQKA